MIGARSEQIRRLNRLLWLRQVLAGAVFDIILVAAFVWFTRSDYEEFSAANVLFGVLIVWAVEIALMVKGFVANLVSLRVVDRQFLAPTFLEVLRNNEMPPPIRKAARLDYLAAVAEDSDYRPDVRVRATNIFATWAAIKAVRGFMAGLIIEQEWDAAIVQYRNEMGDVDEMQWYC